MNIIKYIYDTIIYYYEKINDESTLLLNTYNGV